MSQSDSLDVWTLAGMPGAVTVATYLTTGLSAQYRLIVDVLLEQQQHSLTGVGRDELAQLVRDRVTETTGPAGAGRLLETDTFDLEQRVSQLRAWGVLDVWQDRAVADEDFLRNRDRYQLTELAAELHRAVRALGKTEAAAYAAVLAPAILATQLREMRDALTVRPAGAAQAWAVISPTLDGMASASAGWQSRLAGALAGAPDPDKLAALQDTLRRYVDMWGAGVDTHSDTIAGLATELLAAPDATWRAVALEQAGADADEDRLVDLVAKYRQTLTTVLSWFGGPRSQARVLRRQIRDTIVPLVRGQRTLAAVGGHVSRRADLLALAARLEQADSDETAWSTWCTATGLFCARHLAGRSPMPAGNPAHVSFWDADPVPVETRVRRQGPRALSGRAARVADRSVGRTRAKLRAAQQRAETARTRAAVLARSGQRLDAWNGAPAAEVDLLVTFLAALAAARPDATGARVAVTGDGMWQLRSEPVTSDPAVGNSPGVDESADQAVVVHTPVGRLVHTDMRLTIGLAGAHASLVAGSA